MDDVEPGPTYLAFEIAPRVSAAVPARVRPLGPDTARLRLARPVPLRVGDRALLRDPGRHHVAGVTVLDVAPPPLAPGKRGGATLPVRAWFPSPARTAKMISAPGWLGAGPGSLGSRFWRTRAKNAARL